MRKSSIAAMLATASAIAAMYLVPIDAVFAGAGGGCTVPIPEPSTMAMLAGGVAGILYLHRLRRKK